MKEHSVFVGFGQTTEVMGNMMMCGQMRVMLGSAILYCHSGLSKTKLA